jgi:hypothetical protein
MMPPETESQAEPLPVAAPVVLADTGVEPFAEKYTQKVRPMIGIVIEKMPDTTIAKKKNKIKFFPREKDAPLLSVPEPTTLTARIN